MNLYGAGAECYVLNMKCSSQAHLVNIWSPVGGAILEGGSNFRKQDLAGGSRPSGTEFVGYAWDPVCFLPVFPHSTSCSL
jgi:hypothetical protein